MLDGVGTSKGMGMLAGQEEIISERARPRPSISSSELHTSFARPAPSVVRAKHVGAKGHACVVLRIREESESLSDDGRWMGVGSRWQQQRSSNVSFPPSSCRLTACGCRPTIYRLRFAGKGKRARGASGELLASYVASCCCCCSWLSALPNRQLGRYVGM